MKKSIPIFAEIGMNHMSREVYADQYVDYLGACVHPDGLTFQVREKEHYEKQRAGESTMLPDKYYRDAAKRTKESGMRFGMTLGDIEKIPFFEDIGTEFYKILSRDIGNAELISRVLATGKPVYVSTGLSSEEEIGSFLSGFDSVPPHLSLIHTQLSYECADTNLRAIGRLQERFDIPVAFGLHSTSVNPLYTALGFSPAALFFYVKGDAGVVKHKDEDHAIPLLKCSEVVSEIRRLEIMLGDGIKRKMQNKIKDQQKV